MRWKCTQSDGDCMYAPHVVCNWCYHTSSQSVAEYVDGKDTKTRNACVCSHEHRLPTHAKSLEERVIRVAATTTPAGAAPSDTLVCSDPVHDAVAQHRSNARGVFLSPWTPLPPAHWPAVDPQPLQTGAVTPADNHPHGRLFSLGTV